MSGKSNTKKIPAVRVHLWLEGDDGVYFGPGRYELLFLINELGSLKLAAQKMGMSYRGAWGKIKKTEEVVGKKLIQKNANKDGYSLTESAMQIMQEYKKFHNDVLAYASKNAENMLSQLQASVSNK